MPDRDAPSADKRLLLVGPEEAGQRLDKYLAASGLCLSRTRIQRLILTGKVRIPGCKKISPSFKVQAGQEIHVTIPEPEPLELIPEDVSFKVIYQDSHLIVIDKPPGLVVHPGAGNQQHTLVHGLLYYCDDLSGVGGKLRPGIVHRLDKNTSGLMVAAKNDYAHKALSTQFRLGQVKKIYIALVKGVPEDHSGLIDMHIGRHAVQRKKMAVLPEGRGRKALTTYRVWEEFKTASLLRVRIHTGRTHQIRVHMAAIGHPLLGDPVYGGPRSIIHGDKRIDIPRQMLHSFELVFVHPVSGEEMSFKADLPEDMAMVIKALRKG